MINIHSYILKRFQFLMVTYYPLSSLSISFSSPLCCMLLNVVCRLQCHFMKLSCQTPPPSSSHCFKLIVHTLSKLHNIIFGINCWWLIKGIMPWICNSQKIKIYNLCPASASLPATTLPPLPSQKITSLTSNLATIMCAIIACSVLTCANYNVLP